MTNEINNKNIGKSAVYKDFISLALIRISNLILPLLTIPYLIRTLGIENVGSINLATSIISYALIIMAFGFDYTGTKFISENSKRISVVSNYYSSAMAIRFWLMLLSFLLLFIVTLLVPNFYEIRVILFVSFGSVIGQYLTPNWVFQGFQKMRYLTCIDIFFKVLYTVIVFVFIDEKDDYILVPLFLALTTICSGVIVQITINRNFKIYIHIMNFFKFDELYKMMKKGKDVFLQQIFVSMYGPITVIFLGMIATKVDVGYYTISEKLLSIPVMIVVVAVQAHYPHAVKLYKRDKKSYFNQIFKLMAAIISLMMISIFVICIFGGGIYYLLTGAHDDSGVEILKVLSFGLMFSSLGQLFTQVFITLDKPETLKNISFVIMILTLLLSPIVITMYGVIGLAYYTVFRQSIVIIICVYFIRMFYKEYKNV